MSFFHKSNSCYIVYTSSKSFVKETVKYSAFVSNVTQVGLYVVVTAEFQDP